MSNNELEDRQEPEEPPRVYERTVVEVDEDFGGADPGELAQRPPAVELERLAWLHITRNALALGLALLLGILTTATLVAVIAGSDAESLSRIGQLTITPVVALCGTAFGFYFAQQAHREDR